MVQFVASSCKTGLVAQRIRHLTTNQGIAGSSPAKVNIFGQFMQADKNSAPPGGLEPPTFRLTAERASRLRHGGFSLPQLHHHWNGRAKICFLVSRAHVYLYVHNTASLTSVRYGLVVRIPGSHPGGPGSIPGNGNLFGVSYLDQLLYKSFGRWNMVLWSSPTKD